MFVSVSVLVFFAVRSSYTVVMLVSSAAETHSAAEDHYTADYPDEEVDEDDEFSRNPYQYQTGDVSDVEDMGADDQETYRRDGDDGDDACMDGESDKEMLRKIRRYAERESA